MAAGASASEPKQANSTESAVDNNKMVEVEESGEKKQKKKKGHKKKKHGKKHSKSAES